MKRHIVLVMSVIIAVLTQRVASAQTQPASSYSFSNLVSGVVNAFGTWAEDDFIWSVANVNAGSITVRHTLTESGFQFVHPDGSGGLLCGPNDSYTYPDTTLAQYRTWAWNTLNYSVRPSGPKFQGSLSVQSLGGQSFYIGPPSTFKVSGRGSSACNAHYNAWENGAWWSPWFWDGTASVLVSPYAAMWHNDAFWDKGWDTAINIYNNSSQSVQYTIKYVSDYNGGVPVMRNPNSCSSTTNLNQTKVQTIAASGSWSGSLNTDILAPTSGWTVEEDGFIYVTANPVVGGTAPSSYISANSSGTATSCGSCGFNLTCHN